LFSLVLKGPGPDGSGISRLSSFSRDPPALCGLRRGEIAALRWRSVDLDAGQLAVVASVEQTRAGCREKETKSGRARTVALSTTMIEELRRHRLEQVCYAGLAGGTLRAG
jgi:integrase